MGLGRVAVGPASGGWLPPPLGLCTRLLPLLQPPRNLSGTVPIDERNNGDIVLMGTRLGSWCSNVPMLFACCGSLM